MMGAEMSAVVDLSESQNHDHELPHETPYGNRTFPEQSQDHKSVTCEIPNSPMCGNPWEYFSPTSPTLFMEWDVGIRLGRDYGNLLAERTVPNRERVTPNRERTIPDTSPTVPDTSPTVPDRTPRRQP